uniref:START domain-containing protein n=1 Tax=Aegilops tauschii subsp. strangulata TaxID=200361 RepID=A0A453H541_AEGTS
METRKGILELRDRLDKTLACSDLADEGSLKSLVKNQILESSLPGSDQGNIDLIAEARAKEVSNFLEMLDTSGNERPSEIRGPQQKEWKVKQDTDQLRVMYREGPDGTPFHTLLAEGFADGPIDVCTCVSWESGLYTKWFPQYNLPTFKIAQSGCLKKIRIGEEISLIRVKVPWPVSEREALLHYFQFEYLKEDLVIVIMKTISNLDNLSMQTHGFTIDGIPEAGDTIRMDVVGGFVLQRITKERSFFRAVANMDIKLDFVPPWLINFMSRQLIGSGHKLYQKAVSTVAACDEDYKQALRAPLYARIREYQHSADKAKVTSVEESANEVLPENPTVHNPLAVTNLTPCSEIIEEESEQNTSFKVDNLAAGFSNQPAGQVQQVENKSFTSPDRTVKQAQQVENKQLISPEVQKALGILDTAIAVLQGNRSANISTLRKLLSYDAASEEGSAITTRNSHTLDVLDTDNLPNGYPLATPPHDSREIRQTYFLPDKEMRDREEGASESDSPKNMTASTTTTTKSMTLRSTMKVHEEETLNSDGLYQNGFHSGKEPKRPRKTKRK